MEKTFDDFVDGYYDVADQLPHHVRSLVASKIDDYGAPWSELTSLEAFTERRDTLRERFLDAIGGLPDERTALAAETTGTVDRDSYTVETVVFESLPGFHVTTNLYVPDGIDGATAGVLFLCGHSDTAKTAPFYQRVCIDLARNGMVALAVDPVGQGERHQYYDPARTEYPYRSTLEHTHLDRPFLFAGASVARQFVWDGIRAIDYLESREEVDEDRIGVTGTSGGGTQTSYLMLVEDRLSAAVPNCFITSRDAYAKTGQPQDAEQIVHRSIDRGPTYADFLASFAPRPVRVGAAEWDFFPIEGTGESYERARAAYRLHDCPEHIDVVTAASGHGFPPALREATVNWFRAHLLDLPPDFETGDPSVEESETLWCTDQGEVKAAYAAEKTVPELAREYIEAKRPSATAAVDTAPVKDTVTEAFSLDRDRCPLDPRRIATEREDDLVWEKVFFRSEPDIVVTGTIARHRSFDPVADAPTVVLYERGTDALADRTTEFGDIARESGFAMAFDCRGIGAIRSRDVNDYAGYTEYPGTIYKLACDARMAGASLFGMQVFDVLRANDYLVDRFGDDVDVDLRGYGTGAYRALYSAVVSDTVRRVSVERTDSFHARAMRDVRELNPWLSCYDVIGRFDLPQVEQALGGAVTWLD